MSAFRALIRPGARRLRRLVATAGVDAAPNSLLLVTGGGEWAVKQIALALQAQFRLGYRDVTVLDFIRRRPYVTRANIHFLCRPAFFAGSGIPDVHSSNRLVVSWLHGGRSSGDPEIVAACDQLARHWREVCRFIVPNLTTHRHVVECGVDPAIVHVIPNGVDTRAFSPASGERARHQMRERFGIPADAFVVGSFQRDGDDQGAPKLIKGPDVLVAVLTEVSRRRPLFVLLAGSGRKWVLDRLKHAGVPHHHHWAADSAELASIYHALDAYLIASREEGGPVALRESMASGVPVVSTRMGLAADLLEHGVNGLLAEVGEVPALAEALTALADEPALRAKLATAALQTIQGLDFEVIARRYQDEVYRLAFA